MKWFGECCPMRNDVKGVGVELLGMDDEHRHFAWLGLVHEE